MSKKAIQASFAFLVFACSVCGTVGCNVYMAEKPEAFFVGILLFLGFAYATDQIWRLSNE